MAAPGGWQRYGLTEAASRRLDTYIVEIACALRPEAPSTDSADGIRIGRHGALWIRPDASWLDFEGDVGGNGTLALIVHLFDVDQHDISLASATQFAQRWLADHPGEGLFNPAPFDPSQVTRKAQLRAQFAEQVLCSRQDVSGTEAERYLNSRGLFTPFPNTVAFYPNARNGEAALVGIRSMPDGRIVGVQLGYVDPQGRKSTIEPKRLSFLSELDPDKRRGSAFRVAATPVPEALNAALGPAEADSDDDEVHRLARNARRLAGTLLICEGLEDALSLHVAFPYSAIIGLPGVGALRHQPVKANQAVIVVKDGDAFDAVAVRSLRRGLDELLLLRAEVRETSTPEKRNGTEKVDANLILQRDGREALQALVLAAEPTKLSLRGAIRRLAGLPNDEREVERRQIADHYKVRVSYLDRETELLRAKVVDSDEKGLAGLVRRDPEPWAGPVDLGKVFDELVDLIKRVLVCTEAERWVITAWIVHTFVFEQFTYTPRLCILSPEPRCGKTTLINLLTHTCYRAAQADGLSPALFVRLKSVTGACTVLLDEMSEALHESQELDDVLRSGFEREKQVLKLRAMPDGTFVPEAFDVFNPVAVAVLRALQPALNDRSLVVRLQRKPHAVRVERLRRRMLRERAQQIADKLARWRLEGGATLSDDLAPDGDVDPIDALTAPLEDSIANDRQIDFSIPLLAIGRAMGGRKEAQLLLAIQAVLRAGGDSPEAAGVLLLHDLRQILAQHCEANPQSEVKDLVITSARLVQQLTALPDSPWNGEGNFRPLTQYRLSRLLRPYGVLPQLTGAKRVKGYSWAKLSVACDHYLPATDPIFADSGLSPSHLSTLSTGYGGSSGLSPPPQTGLVESPENPTQRVDTVGEREPESLEIAETGPCAQNIGPTPGESPADKAQYKPNGQDGPIGSTASAAAHTTPVKERW
jgi:hypothetical protein